MIIKTCHHRRGAPSVLTVLFIIMVLIRTTSAKCTTSKNTKCSGGCWKKDDGTCAPVGLGHYSPADSNDRIPCEVGTYSNVVEAQACFKCKPGEASLFKGQVSCTDAHSLEHYVKPIMWHTIQANTHMEHYADHLDSSNNAQDNVNAMETHTQAARKHMEQADTLMKKYSEQEQRKIERFKELYADELEALWNK